MVISVTTPVPVAVGQSRFPAAMMRPRINPRDDDLLLRPHMLLRTLCSISSAQSAERPLFVAHTSRICCSCIGDFFSRLSRMTGSDL
jgi:hypothetical protein